MSDKIWDFKWDEEVPETVDAGPADFLDIGILRLAAVKKVTMFASGEKIVLPNVLINGQPWERAGMKEGHTSGKDRNNVTAFFLTYDGVNNKTGDSFTAVRIYTNQTAIPVSQEELDKLPVVKLNDLQTRMLADGKVIYLSDWANLQFPALKAALNPAQQTAFQNGQSLYFSAHNWTYRTRENPNQLDDAGNPKKYYDRYWYNFTFYQNEAEMLAARGNGVVKRQQHAVPAAWANSPRQALVDFVLKLYKENVPVQAIAAQAGLIGAKDAAGNNVDTAGLMAEILDVPEATIHF